MDAANYKHVVLGLIFLKYVSDAFEERQEELLELFKTESNDNIYYLPREDFDSDEDYQQALTGELELPVQLYACDGRMPYPLHFKATRC